MSLKAEGLSHFYHGLAALDSVALDLPAGSLAVVCGSNGSGKSTLLRCLAGLQKPSKGKVTIDGLPVSRARRNVALAIQYPERALFSRTLADDLAFAPENAGLSPREVADRVDRSLAAVGLSPDLLTRSHKGLSYGQKRLAGLAAVLSGGPSYLFLDEPTAGLDYAGKQRIRSLLAGLVNAGTTVVVASHDPALFLEGCQQLIVLKEGRVVSAEPPDKTDLGAAGIRSDTLALAQKLRALGWGVPETFSPELLADQIAEVILGESARLA